MVSVKDVLVKKPSEHEAEAAAKWPVWGADVSKFDWVYTEKETCLLIEGKVRVSDSAGNSVSFGAGDWVEFPDELECVWEILEPVKKYYTFG